MTKVAVRGLAQRKLRARRDHARDPARGRVHRRELRPHGHDQPLLRRHLRRGLRGHRRRGLVEHHGPGRQRRPAAVLGALPRPGARRARRGGSAAGGIFSLGRFVDEKGDPLSNSFAPEFISSMAPEPFQTLTYTEGRPPRDLRRGLDRRVHGGSRGSRDRRHPAHRRPGRGQGPYRIVGLQRLGNTSGGGSGTAQLTLPEAQRITDKPGELDGISIKAAPGVTRARAAPADRSRAAGAARRGDRQRGRRPPGPGHQGRPLVLPRGAARVRRRGAAGGQLPDLQHLLDHGRPADPRVRAAAHAGREPPPDPRRHDPRGAAARSARRWSRRAGRDRVRRGARGRVHGLRHRPAQHRHRGGQPHDHRGAGGGDLRHARLRPGAGAAGHARDARWPRCSRRSCPRVARAGAIFTGVRGAAGARSASA